MANLTRKQKEFIKRNVKEKSPEEIARAIGVNRTEVIKYINLMNLTQKDRKVEKIFPLTVENIYKFTKTDYIIFLILFSISLALYVYTITPGIAAGDCGELTCAVYFLGGAHSPGYPLYCIIGKLFMWLFYPIGRIVYRLTFLSAFGGALTVALSYLVFIKFLGRYHNKNKQDNLFFAKIPSIAASLYFAFTDDLWAQSVIAEVYTLNSLFLPMMFLIALVYEERITSQPNLLKSDRNPMYHWNPVVKILYLFYFLFGVAMGDHHIILGYFMPFTYFLLYPHFSDKKFFKIFIASTLAFILALIIVVYYKLPESFDNMAKIIILVLLGYSVVKIYEENPEFLKVVIIAGIFLVLGLLVYAYMPIRSKANAPLDWGNPETLEKFITVVTRKQYRGFAQNVRSLQVFIKQAIILMKWRVEQFTPWLYIFTFFGLYRLFKINRKWFYFTLSFLFYYDLAFMQFNNFKFTPRDMFFAEVFFIPSYMINIIWIAIGIEFVFVSLDKYLANQLQDEKKHLLVRKCAALVFILLSYFPFKAHFALNNVRHAWANDNYGRNLLKTLEYKSILFTEGGDNQVFSLLYHTYVEHRRPDVNIYDQKGNVFLLYGDMMRMNPIQLFESQVTNDYKKIKTGRPIYYTWKDYRRQNEINKLYTIERYILRNYKHKSLDELTKDVIQLARGQKVSVGPLKRVSTGAIMASAAEVIARSKINEIIEKSETLNKLAIFNKYNKRFEYRQTGILYKVCPKDEIFIPPIDYWLYYDFAWENYPDEAIHWDYLSREIIANYNFQIGDEFLAKAYKAYNKLQNPLISPKEKKKYREKYKKFKEIAFKYYRRAKKFGFDMTAIHFNLGLLLEQQINIYKEEGDIEGINKLLDEAISNYLRAAEIENKQDNAPRAFFAAGRAYERKARFNPEKETTYMSNALKYYKEALTINPNYRDANLGVRRVQGYLKAPTKKIKEMEKELNLNPKNENLYLKLTRAYIDRFQYSEAVKVLERGVRAIPNSFTLLINLGNLYTQLNRPKKAIKLWKKVLTKNPSEPNALFYLAENYYKEKEYKKAFNNYQKFINVVRGINNPQVRNMIARAQQRIRSILPYITQ